MRRVCVAIPSVGTWLSLVEHSLGVRGVGSSNLPVPTILVCRSDWTPIQLDGPASSASLCGLCGKAFDLPWFQSPSNFI